MRSRVLLAVMGSLLATAPVVRAEQIGALLTGYEEVPSVSTTATGEFIATISSDESSIAYSETYSGVTGSRNAIAHPCRPTGREWQHRHISVPDAG